MRLTGQELSLLIDSYKTEIVRFEDRMDEVKRCKRLFDKDLLDAQIKRIESEIASIKSRIEELQSASTIDSL